MKYFSVVAILLCLLILSSCTHSGKDITIVDNTNDSLYFYIHQYKKEHNYTYNIAYASVDSSDTNNPDPNISYNINPCKLLPHDSVNPPILNSTWKAFASKQKGLTILFYKRSIEKLPVKAPLSAGDIFKRIDLTAKQLDSLKYRIELN